MEYEKMEQLIDLIRAFNSSDRAVSFRDLEMLDELIADASKEVSIAKKRIGLYQEAFKNFNPRRGD